MKDQKRKVVIIEDHDDKRGFYYPQSDQPVITEDNIGEWIDAFTHKILPEDVLVENAVEYRITGDEYFVPEHPLGYTAGTCNGFFDAYIMTMPVDYQIDDFLRIRGAELIMPSERFVFPRAKNVDDEIG
jgi:hypothetical protein